MFREWTAQLRDVTLLRWLRLFGGLWLFGTGIALMVNARLGLAPWDVLSQGVALRTGLRIGTVTMLVGAVVLLLWFLIRERPGIGTVANIVLIGQAINLTLPLLPEFESVPIRFLELLLGMLVLGLGSAFYLGARLGAGPRDGLMLGLHRRTGWSIRVTRTVIEVCALTVGWLLGGTVGVGTIVLALGIGPVVQFMIRLVDPRSAAAKYAK